MKKVVLLACVMVVSGFACSDFWLKQAIDRYNKCIKRSYSNCEKERKRVEDLQSEYSRCQNDRINDEVRKLNDNLNSKLRDIESKLNRLNGR